MSETDRAAIEIHDLGKSFDEGRVKALVDADLVVQQGEFVAVIGPSGCGKSTLLHLIAALDRPDTGTIVVNGWDLRTAKDLSRFRAMEVGLVFQLDNLIPTLSASENVQVPMFESHLSAHDRVSRAAQLLEMVDLADKAKNRPPQLSGGERQRVAVARALANDPHILLADEPTGRLDSGSGRKILDLIKSLQVSRGLTTILVTHDPIVAARADRVVQMLDGRTVGAEETAAALTTDSA